MSKNEIREWLGEINPETLLADGFEDAFIGIAWQFNKALACYDRRKCVNILMDRDGMSEDEADEYFEFNVTGAYMGEYTPVFLVAVDREEKVK